MTEGNDKKMKYNNSSSAFDFIKSSFLYQQWEGAGFLLFACAQDRTVSDYPVAGATTISRFSSCSKRTYYCQEEEDNDDGVLIVWDNVVCSQQQQQQQLSTRRQRDRMYLRKQSILHRRDSDIFRDELPSSQSSIDTCTTATMQTTSFDDEEFDDDRCNDHNDDDHPREDDHKDRVDSIFRVSKNQRSTNPLTLGTSLGFYKSPALAFDDDDEEDDDNSIIIYEDDEP